MQYLLILIILLIANPAFAGEAQTINTIPRANATFLSDLQNYLREEQGDREFIRVGGTVIKGGYHASGAGLTHTLPECITFVEGHYVLQVAVSHTYTASKRTFVYTRAYTDTTLTFAGATVTYDNYFAFAETASSTSAINTPSGFIPIMYVDTDATDVTSVTDQRAGYVPASYFPNLANALTNTTNRTLIIDEWWVLTANTTIATTNHVVCTNNARIICGNYTLTVAGAFDAPDLEIIDDSGPTNVVYTTKTRIINNAWTGDSSIEVAIAGTKMLTIDANGVRITSQPAFFAQPTSAQTNIQTATDVQIAFGTERYDVGADFSTYTYTAGISGKHYFGVHLQLEDVDADASLISILLVTTDRTYTYSFMPYTPTDTTDKSLAFSSVLDLTAADTVEVKVNQSGGEALLDIATDSWFCGGLLF